MIGIRANLTGAATLPFSRVAGPEPSSVMTASRAASRPNKSSTFCTAQLARGVSESRCKPGRPKREPSGGSTRRVRLVGSRKEWRSTTSQRSWSHTGTSPSSGHGVEHIQDLVPDHLQVPCTDRIHGCGFSDSTRVAAPWPVEVSVEVTNKTYVARPTRSRRGTFAPDNPHRAETRRRWRLDGKTDGSGGPS